MYKNKGYLPITEVRQLFNWYSDAVSLNETGSNPLIAQLETIFQLTNQHTFKILHPLFIQSYKTPMTNRFSDTPMKTIGLDIETNAKTGEPMLLGLWYPPPIDVYVPTFKPTLTTLFELINQTQEINAELVTWGSLDIQAIIRLFEPTQEEAAKISRGLSAHIVKGEIIGDPPLARTILYEGKSVNFYVAHYISGRSLKLGYIIDNRSYSRWIFNVSQFLPGTIKESAQGLGLPWTEFSKDTHIVDWTKYSINKFYRSTVHASNRQDAHTVMLLSQLIQERFFSVFACYPKLLVSNGSLTDTAVAKMLEGRKEDYASMSWAWLMRNVWDMKDTDEQANQLLASVYSAGYVDQFAVGYFPKVFQADISSAYPAVIRTLPDLRHSRLVYGMDTLEEDISALKSNGYIIETAIIEGQVTIPPNLKFHPITIKTAHRENIRPQGTFFAGYLLEEKEYCQKYGATFSQERYVIVALTKRVLSPIAEVSQKLGDLRADLLAQTKAATNQTTKTFLDGQQYIAKTIDNAMYGKTVQTIEVVENIDDIPQVTGYSTGDRFNLLYGSIITARTRIIVSEACMDIVRNFGTPICVMTDAVVWEGTGTELSDSVIRDSKTAGYFERPQQLDDFYILKTGQYEYRKGTNWTYKLRGLNVDFAIIDGKRSFYHRLLLEKCQPLKSFIHPRDIKISISSKRLITVGSHRVGELALIDESPIELRPFQLSSKQEERYIRNWKTALNDHVWLQTPTITDGMGIGQQYPLEYLNQLQEHILEIKAEETHMRKLTGSNKRNLRQDILKMRYLVRAMKESEIPPPPGRAYRLNWDILVNHFGLERKPEEIEV